MIDRINLIPEEIRPVDKGSFYLLSAVSTILYISILFFLYAGQSAKLEGSASMEQSLKKQAAGVKARAEALSIIKNNIADVEVRKNELNRKYELISTLEKSRLSWADSLYELSKLVPSGVWLTGLSSSKVAEKEEGTYYLSFGGMSLSMDLIADFIEDLNSSDYFKQAAMKFANKSEYKGKDLFSFEAALVMETR